MGAFGRAAVLTAQRLQRNQGLCPLSEWDRIINRMRLSNSTRQKCCARNAFLGLCQANLIMGINPCICHPRITTNGQYAVDAALILSQNGQRLTNLSQKALWLMIPNHPRSHNQQMDVVISLRNSGLI